jgi:hypothetical protein
MQPVTTAVPLRLRNAGKFAIGPATTKGDLIVRDACSAEPTKATTKATTQSRKRIFIQYVDPQFVVKPLAGLAHGVGEGAEAGGVAGAFAPAGGWAMPVPLQWR